MDAQPTIIMPNILTNIKYYRKLLLYYTIITNIPEYIRHSSMRITGKYTLPGVQRIIRQMMDIDGLSPMQLSKSSGVHFTTLYGILKRADNRRRRPVRRSTIMALGMNLGYHVSFDHVRKEISFERPDMKPHSELDDLVMRIRSVLIQSGKKSWAEEDRRRIIHVLKALIFQL